MNTALLFLLVLVHTIVSQQCNAHYGTCLDMNCGSPIELGSNFTTGCGIIRACSSKDIGSRLSACVNGQQTLFYFWLPPATCQPSDTVQRLPVPITFACTSDSCLNGGHTFNVATRTCDTCPVGTFSQSGTYLIDNWDRWPSPQFTTSCRNGTGAGCEKWTVNGDYIDSGDFTFSRYGDSSLEFRFETVKRNAVLSFEYQTTGRTLQSPLFFVVNGRSFQALPATTNGYSKISYTVQEPGFVSAYWRFSKSSITGSAESVRIRSIRVDGVSNIQTSCTPCPADSYADQTGSFSCKECPRGYVSPAGASACTAYVLPACSTNDYHFEYTKCVNGIRSKTAVWTQSALCNPLAAGSATLPAASNEPCTISCKPGQIVQDNACAYCPNGQKLDNGACVACAPGTAASNKIYHVDQFSASDLSLNTTCFGDCYSDGWRYAQTYAESGMGGKDMDSWLRIAVPTGDHLSDNITVSVEYAMSCLDGTFDIYFNFMRQGTFQCGGCSSLNTFTKATFTVPIVSPIDTSYVRLRYRKRDSTSNNYYGCDRVVVKSVSVVGASVGTAQVCAGCEPGTYFNSTNVVCAACQAGTYNNASNQATCNACPENTFSFTREDSCVSCGNVRESKSGSASCQWKYGTCALNTELDGVSRTLSWFNVSLALVNRAFYTSGSTFYFSLCQSAWSSAAGSMIAKRIGATPLQSIGDTIYVRPLTDAMGISARLYTRRSIQCPRAFTNLTMTCTPDPRSTLQVKITEIGCSHDITISDRSLCPACLAEDYDELRGECENGNRTVMYVKKTGFAHNCVGGVQARPATVESCSRSVEAPYWILVVIGLIVAAIFVAIAAVAIFFFIKYRRTQDSFQRLRDEHDTVSADKQEL